MDQLHEELKEPVSCTPTPAALLQGKSWKHLTYKTKSSSQPKVKLLTQNHFSESGRAASFEDLSDDDDSEKRDFGQHEGGASSQSEGEYETCDSGVSERSSLSDECLERRNSSCKMPR